MKFTRISSVSIGLLMVAQWVFFLLTDNVPELESAPLEIVFHISIEIITAGLLIFSAIIHNKKALSQTLLLFGQGMLAYTVVNSSGYFAQSGDWALVGMFTVLLGISIYNATQLYKALSR